MAAHAFFSRLRGTIETILQIGRGGPQLKDVAGVITMRDATDAANARAAGADPTAGSQQFATAAYAENYATAQAAAAQAAAIATANAGTVKVIKIAIVADGVKTQFDSVTTLPVGYLVEKVRAKASIAFSAGTTLNVGTPTTPTNFVNGSAANDDFAMDAVSLPLFIKEQSTTPTNPGEVVRVTLSGAAAVGTGFVEVFYYPPNV